jgi:hypothetical protein
MSTGRDAHRLDGRLVVALSWAAAGVLHARTALLADAASPAVRAVAGALAVAAVAGVALLLARRDRRVLLAATVAGAVGVGLWFVTTLFPGPAGPRLDLWTFAAVLLDSLTVRLAFFALRRLERSGPARR